MTSTPEIVAQWFSSNKKDFENKVHDSKHSKASSNDSAADSTPALVPFAPNASVTNHQDPQNNACDTAAEAFCICKGPEKGRMIGCDNQNCPDKWFHFTCVGLKRALKTQLCFCGPCRNTVWTNCLFIQNKCYTPPKNGHRIRGVLKHCTVLTAYKCTTNYKTVLLIIIDNNKANKRFRKSHCHSRFVRASAFTLRSFITPANTSVQGQNRSLISVPARVPVQYLFALQTS